MVDPPAVYDFEPATGILTCLKRRVVPGYAPEDFEQLRFWATSADGTAVPYTVARRRGAPRGRCISTVMGPTAWGRCRASPLRASCSWNGA